jgi:hypothetical protein
VRRQKTVFCIINVCRTYIKMCSRRRPFFKLLRRGYWKKKWSRRLVGPVVGAWWSWSLALALAARRLTRSWRSWSAAGACSSRLSPRFPFLVGLLDRHRDGSLLAAKELSLEREVIDQGCLGTLILTGNLFLRKICGEKDFFFICVTNHVHRLYPKSHWINSCPKAAKIWF